MVWLLTNYECNYTFHHLHNSNQRVHSLLHTQILPGKQDLQKRGSLPFNLFAFFFFTFHFTDGVSFTWLALHSLEGQCWSFTGKDVFIYLIGNIAVCRVKQLQWIGQIQIWLPPHQLMFSGFLYQSYFNKNEVAFTPLHLYLGNFLSQFYLLKYSNALECIHEDKNR